MIEKVIGIQGYILEKINRRKTYKKKIKDIVDKACNIYIHMEKIE